MSYPAAAIREAIADVLHGASGSVRTVTAGEWLYGIHEGQTDLKQRAGALRRTAGGDPVHRFDIELGQLRQHGSSPVSALSRYRVCLLPITINVLTHTKADRAAARSVSIADVMTDMDTAIQALHYPGNLSYTSEAVATQVIGGILLGPGGEGSPDSEIVQQVSEKNTLRSRISGSVLLQITQA